MKLLMFAASLSQDSCNRKLITVASDIAKEQGITPHVIHFADISGPLYNPDVQNTVGFPKEVTYFHACLQQADGLVIASPEYNFSVPGTLKNLIDWVSRLRPMPWKNCPVLLMSASPSVIGGNRGLWATRIPLEACGALVHPDMFSLPSAYGAFDEHGKLKDEATFKRLKENVGAFGAYAGAVKGL